MTDIVTQLAHLEALQYAIGSGHQTTTYGGNYVAELRDEANRLYTRPLGEQLKAHAAAGTPYDEAIADLRALIRTSRDLARIDTFIRGLEHAASCLDDAHPTTATLSIKIGLARGDRAAAVASAADIRRRIIDAINTDVTP
jgi:hypothetical protein